MRGVDMNDLSEADSNSSIEDFVVNLDDPIVVSKSAFCISTFGHHASLQYQIFRGRP